MTAALSTTHSLKVKHDSFTFVPLFEGTKVLVTAYNRLTGASGKHIAPIKKARLLYADLLRQGAVTNTKRYTHDCDDCHYLGTCWSEGRWYDLYVCGFSFVARYGNDGPEYSSVRSAIDPSLYPNHHKLAYDLFRNG
jgi:hypothetical protein